MDVIGILRKKRQRVTAYAIELVGAAPRRASPQLHRDRGRASPGGRRARSQAIAEAIELSDTKYCSVHATLVPGVTVTSRFVIAPSAAGV
jgi:putative redox protein